MLPLATKLPKISAVIRASHRSNGFSQLRFMSQKGYTIPSYYHAGASPLWPIQDAAIPPWERVSERWERMAIWDSPQCHCHSDELCEL
jgi:hypothetical protein